MHSLAICHGVTSTLEMMPATHLRLFSSLLPKENRSQIFWKMGQSLLIIPSLIKHTRQHTISDYFSLKIVRGTQVDYVHGVLLWNSEGGIRVSRSDCLDLPTNSHSFNCLSMIRIMSHYSNRFVIYLVKMASNRMPFALNKWTSLVK